MPRPPAASGPPASGPISPTCCRCAPDRPPGGASPRARGERMEAWPNRRRPPTNRDAAASARPLDAAEQSPSIEDHIETVRVRRAPKYSVFLVVGAALGLLVAMILTFAFNGTGGISPNTGLVYSQSQVFGFLVAHLRHRRSRRSAASSR